MPTKKRQENGTDQPGMTDGQIEETARLFGVLAEPARLYLLRALMEGEETVGGLAMKTGLKQGTVSKHLGILHAAGFLVRRRDGVHVCYAISDPVVEKLCGLMCDRMRREAVRQYARLGL